MIVNILTQSVTSNPKQHDITQALGSYDNMHIQYTHIENGVVVHARRKQRQEKLTTTAHTPYHQHHPSNR